MKVADCNYLKMLNVRQLAIYFLAKIIWKEEDREWASRKFRTHCGIMITRRGFIINSIIQSYLNGDESASSEFDIRRTRLIIIYNVAGLCLCFLAYMPKRNESRERLLLSQRSTPTEKPQKVSTNNFSSKPPGKFSSTSSC